MTTMPQLNYKKMRLKVYVYWMFYLNNTELTILYD